MLTVTASSNIDEALVRVHDFYVRGYEEITVKVKHRDSSEWFVIEAQGEEAVD